MELCLGTVQFGLDYGIQRAGQPQLSESLDMLDYATQNGVCAIDTASAYGTAETVVGAFVKEHGNIREKLEIITKLPPNALEDKSRNQYAAAIRESLMHSLRLLNTDYLDGYLLHNPTQVFEDAIVDELFKLKHEGLVRYVGASIYTTAEAKKGIERGLDLLQIPYSVLDQRMDEQGVLDLAQRKGVKLHSRSAFTQGLILMDEPDIPPHLEKAKPVVRKLSRFCKEHGVTRVQLAISFVGRKESITHLVFGVDNLKQLLEIIDAHRQLVSKDVLEEAVRQFTGLDEETIMPSLWKK